MYLSLSLSIFEKRIDEGIERKLYNIYELSIRDSLLFDHFLLIKTRKSRFRRRKIFLSVFSRYRTLINALKIVEKNFTESQTQQVFQRENRFQFYIYICESQPLKKVRFCTCNHLYGKLCTMKIFNVYLLADHYLPNKSETTLANVIKLIQNILRTFAIWFLIFLTFTDIPYVQYFLSVVKKFYAYQKKKKNWISHSKYRFEKFAGRKTHRMKNK